jgi:hypothetical protein
MSVGQNSDKAVLVPLALFIAGGFAIRYGLRWYRLSRIPTEVKEYVGLANRAEQMKRRRDLLKVVRGLSAVLLAISLLNVFLTWGQVPVEWYWIAYGVPVFMLLAFLLSLVALRRFPEQR